MNFFGVFFQKNLQMISESTCWVWYEMREKSSTVSDKCDHFW